MQRLTPQRPLVAVIGDGQLARMMAAPANELGIRLRLLAGTPDASAAQVCSDVQLGDYTSLADLERAAAGADAVTFDHEHVPNAHLDRLIAAGVNVQPQPGALIFAQDKLEQRTRLSAMGLPVPRFAAIESVADALEFSQLVDARVCLKARRGGYDGHGVWFPEGQGELVASVEKLLAEGVPLMAEEKIAFDRELSALVARNPSGQLRAWPVVESIQSGGICVAAIAPAPGAVPERAAEVARAVAEGLKVTGVLAVELFEAGGEVFVNELAMRPHNTGHWTQDGSVTSQFEQHLRAVLDLPLGETTPTAPATVMVNTLGPDQEPELPIYRRVHAVMARFPHAKVHLYGKESKPGRKLGHVNVSGSDWRVARREAELAAHFLVHAVWADGYAAEDAFNQ